MEGSRQISGWFGLGRDGASSGRSTRSRSHFDFALWGVFVGAVALPRGELCGGQRASRLDSSIVIVSVGDKVLVSLSYYA